MNSPGSMVSGVKGALQIYSVAGPPPRSHAVNYSRSQHGAWDKLEAYSVVFESERPRELLQLLDLDPKKWTTYVRVWSCPAWR